MALGLNISLCTKDACTKITFKELTGVYNVSTNPTGYGSPNPLYSSATAASLLVTDPSGVTTTINLLTHGFPTNITTFEYDLPITGPIVDGEWIFVYTVTIGSVYTVTKSSLFLCNVKCCVDKMLLDIDMNSKQDDINNYIKAKTFLDSLKHYAYCGSLDKFTNIYKVLKRMCANTNCKSCN